MSARPCPIRRGGRTCGSSAATVSRSTCGGLIEQRFRRPAEALWLIAGDLNDHVERDGAPEPLTALAPLYEDGFAVDLLARIEDPRARWTYHYLPLDIYARPDQRAQGWPGRPDPPAE